VGKVITATGGGVFDPCRLGQELREHLLFEWRQTPGARRFLAEDSGAAPTFSPP